MVPLHALSPDLLLLILIELEHLRDIVNVRSCCRILRQFTSSLEVWVVLVQQRWTHLHQSAATHALALPRRAVRTLTVSGSVLPQALCHVPSLVDVFARLLPMPSEMHPIPPSTTQSSSAAVDDAVDMAAATVSEVCVVRFASANGAPACAMSDRSFPPMRLAWDAASDNHPTNLGSGARVRPPLPFATDASGLGAPGQWALRLVAYFETTVREQSDHPDGVAVGLGVPGFAESARKLPGRGGGSVALLTGSGTLCYCAPGLQGGTSTRVQLNVKAKAGDVVGTCSRRPVLCGGHALPGKC